MYSYYIYFGSSKAAVNLRHKYSPVYFTHAPDDSYMLSLIIEIKIKSFPKISNFSGVIPWLFLETCRIVY